MKALVGAFNQEKALVGAFSVIVKTGCGTDWALHSTSKNADDRQISLTRWARGTQCHKGEETPRPVETQSDADTASNQSSSSCPIPCSPAGLNIFCLECYSFPKLNNLHSGSHDPLVYLENQEGHPPSPSVQNSATFPTFLLKSSKKVVFWEK